MPLGYEDYQGYEGCERGTHAFTTLCNRDIFGGMQLGDVPTYVSD
jgi:hypothetical protein